MIAPWSSGHPRTPAPPVMWSQFGCLAAGLHLWPVAKPHDHMITICNFYCPSGKRPSYWAKFSLPAYYSLAPLYSNCANYSPPPMHLFYSLPDLCHASCTSPHNSNLYHTSCTLPSTPFSTHVMPLMYPIASLHPLMHLPWPSPCLWCMLLHPLTPSLTIPCIIMYPLAFSQ